MTPLPCGMPSFVSPSKVVASSYTLLDQSSALPGAATACLGLDFQQQPG